MAAEEMAAIMVIAAGSHRTIEVEEEVAVVIRANSVKLDSSSAVRREGSNGANGASIGIFQSR